MYFLANIFGSESYEKIMIKLINEEFIEKLVTLYMNKKIKKNCTVFILLCINMFRNNNGKSIVSFEKSKEIIVVLTMILNSKINENEINL